MTETYDVDFFDENIRVGLAAAEIVLPWVIEHTKALSVIDVGCGSGAWLSVAKTLGCAVLGCDGHVPDDQLLIEPHEFQRGDLTDGVTCIGYDLAMCLEVAEHLPQTSAANLVDGLCEARYVFWSAAIPGQRGVNHINEQWPSWWEPYFNAHGYFGSYDIRREFWGDQRIAGFYRQNFLMWAKPDDLAAAGFLRVIDEVHPDRELGL